MKSKVGNHAFCHKLLLYELPRQLHVFFQRQFILHGNIKGIGKLCFWMFLAVLHSIPEGRPVKIYFRRMGRQHDFRSDHAALFGVVADFSIARMKINRRQCITYAFVIVAYIVLQILSGQKLLSSTARGMLVPICAYVVMAISLNLTVGVMGELSLGHAGFMSVGAFMGTTAAVSLQGVIASAPLRLAIAMVIGAIFAAIIGFLIGIPVLRLRGDYLAIVTLAFGEIIKSIFTNLYIGLDSRGYHIRFLQAPENLEEGGKLILGGPMGIGGVQKIATFTGGFILVMLCLIVIFHLVNSRTGRAILAIRDNRIAAESVGIPVTRYKMTAFVISASMAGAAGALFALNYSTIAANKFDFNASILILVFVVFGGLGNMLGSVIAAALLTALPEALRSFADYRMLIYAIVLILVMLATNNDDFKALLRRVIPGRKEEREDV